MWAFVHGTVIDTVTGARQPDTTVLVNRGRITTVGPSALVTIPDQATVVDATGKYLIPGLADMHAHSSEDDRIDPPLQVAAGVTMLREMWGKPHHHEWRRRVQNGTLLGPHWVIGSFLVDGKQSLWSDIPGEHELLLVGTPDDARQAVAEVIASDADFLKVYSRVPAEAYRALLDEANRRGVPVAGHRPDSVDLTQAIDLGQRSIEHVHALWPATSRESERMEAAMTRLDPKPGPGLTYSSWFRQLNEIEWEAINTYSPFTAKDVFGRMVAHDVAYTPTLVMHQLLDKPDLARPDDPRMRYVPTDLQEFWQFVVDQLYAAGRTVDESAKRRVLFERRLRTVGAMSDAGVRILAGTDLGTGFLYPGFSLHDELELLVRGGMSPLKALQAATLEPARYLGMEHERGTIHPANIADLVVLDADPLVDIRNTQRIHGVMAAGRYLGPDERRRVMDEAAAAAAGDTVAADDAGTSSPEPTSQPQPVAGC